MIGVEGTTPIRRPGINYVRIEAPTWELQKEDCREGGRAKQGASRCHWENKGFVQPMKPIMPKSCNWPGSKICMDI